MPEDELDNQIRQLLIDAIKLDQERLDTEPYETFSPSEQHKQEMAAMLKDPQGWADKQQ